MIAWILVGCLVVAAAVQWRAASYWKRDSKWFDASRNQWMKAESKASNEAYGYYKRAREAEIALEEVKADNEVQRANVAGLEAEVDRLNASRKRLSADACDKGAEILALRAELNEANSKNRTAGCQAQGSPGLPVRHPYVDPESLPAAR